MSKSTRRELHTLVEKIEALLAEQPVRGSDGRVYYVAVAKPEGLPRRAKQALTFIRSHKQATSKALQRGLRVNRNVIAGALHELRQAGAIRAEALA